MSEGGIKDDLLLKMGEVSGKLDLMLAEQRMHGDRLDRLDTRLRGVETKGAKHGAASGGLVAVGVSLIKEMFGIHSE
jgi:hypothetical protein